MHTLALVERITFSDLAACAPRTGDWRKAGAAAPLHPDERRVPAHARRLPARVRRHHRQPPGRGRRGCARRHWRVGDADLRRGIELQAKSHLIHLREGYIESGGNPKAVGQLIAASAPALSSLLANLRRLDPAAAERAGITGELVKEIAGAADATIADPSPLLARYLSAVERLWQEVDRWRA